MQYRRLTALFAAAALLLCGCQKTGDPAAGQADPVTQTDAQGEAVPLSDEALTTTVKAERLTDFPSDLDFNSLDKTPAGICGFKSGIEASATTILRWTPDLSDCTTVMLPKMASYDGFYDRGGLLSVGADGYYRFVQMENHCGMDPNAIPDTDYDQWNEYYGQDVQMEYYLCTYTADGTLSGKLAIRGLEDYLEVDGVGVDVMPQSLYCSGEQRYLTLTDCSILRIGTDGTVTQTQPKGEDGIWYYQRILTDRDGKPVCYERHEETGDNGACMIVTSLHEFDSKTGKTGDLFWQSAIPMRGNDPFVLSGGYGEYRLFANGENGLLGIRDDGTAEPVIDWSASDLDPLSVLPLDDGTFLGYGMPDEGKGDGRDLYFHLTRLKASEASRNRNLVLGVVSRDYAVKEFVQNYNRSHDIHISVRSYSSEDKMDDKSPIDALKADIVTGNGPDLVVMYDHHDQFLKLGSKAVFEDLNGYLESDPEVSRDKLVPNVIKAMEHPDGSLYGLASGFVVDTIAVKSKFTDKESWTMDDMIGLYEGADDIFYYWSTKEEMLQMFLYGMDFTDELAGTCSFDSPAFVKMLEFCNRYPLETTRPEKQENDWSASQDWYTRKYHSLQNDEEYLRPLEISAPGGGFALSEWSYAKAELGGPFTLVGYPSENGQGGKIKQCSAHYTQLGEIGIVSTCTDKEAAWDVVREFTKDSMEYSERPAFSIFDETFEEQLDGMMYVWEDGQPVGQGSVEDDNTVYPMTQEERDDLERYIRGCETYMMIDQTVRNIVLEEAGMYFAGDQSAEEAAGKIQNRAELYLSEQN